MENSPLRFLDYDVSQKLTNDLRIVKEDYARKFHEKNFQDSIDENIKHHYKISKVYDFMYMYSLYILEKCNVKEHIKQYEQECEYLENTKLQRCGYNFI